MSEEQPGDRLTDLWAWADEDDDALDPDPILPSVVTAVMVVRDAADWLPEQLVALGQLESRPGRVIAVDNGSTDESPRLLAEAVEDGILDEVIRGNHSWSFGRAVAEAVGEQAPEWLWLLHDDSAPRPHALTRLLKAAPTADLIFPKLLQPPRRNYPDTLAEVGQSITMGGHRVLTVEEGDIDQHQVDPAAVLGGSTAGLLIRGTAWTELGGLAPEVARHRDGVDLGWRANAAGWRVVTAPEVSLVHRASGRIGERETGRHPHEDDRLAALTVVSARGANRFYLVLISWIRALGFLLAKSPGHATAELRALRRWRRSSDQVEALAARLPAVEDEEIADLLPNHFWPLRNAVDRMGTSLSERYRTLTSQEVDTSIDELTSDDYVPPRPPRRLINPLTLLTLGLLITGVIAGWSLVGRGTVAGGGLLPAPASLAEAWRAFVEPIAAGGNAPWLGFAAIGSLLSFGQANAFVITMLMIAPLLAGLSAFTALRAFDVRPPLAGAAAGAWAAAVIVLGLVTAGDLTGMVLAVAGPRLVVSLYRVASNDAGGAERLRRPASAALWLVVIASAWPAALVLVTVLAIGAAVSRRVTWSDALVTVLPVWLFLGPWLPTLVSYPGRLLTGVDPMAWPDFPPSSYGVLAGRLIPSGLPVWLNLAFFVVLGIVAAVGLVRIRRAAVRWAALAAIGVPMLLGVAASRIALPVMGGEARASLTAWALLVVAGALAPVVLSSRSSDGNHGGRRRSTSAIALGLASALVAVTWAVVGFNGAVQLTRPVLPGYVRDVISSPRDTRALLIQRHSDTQLSWNVVDAHQPQWGTGERNPAGADEADYATLVQAFSGATVPEDLAEQLTALGISHVWMSGFPADQLAGVSNAAGLSSAAADDDSTVWTVVGMVSRAEVVDGESREPVVTGTIPKGSASRTLELAESAGSIWHAQVAGEELPRIDRGEDGSLAFDLGERSGELTYGAPAAWWAVAWHGVVLLGLLILLAPTIGSAQGARRGQED
ncbi:glycosyltransferase family 2 protein [Tessaracoccus caeni]|uniref:glycosyltransferase family 2 protein n=1 Tax=Tessaracoccus caeni TaxID=3031239 RepID=UPI0023DBBEFC|nr:glycosyltransferase [Tessaracoccus caeni]MDF1488919.1 glycosyltransferase [Tessaracoccus caeni]